MKTKEEILKKHLEIAKNPSKWDDVSISEGIYESYHKAMDEYANQDRLKLFEVIYSLYIHNGGLTNTAYKIFEEMGLTEQWKEFVKSKQ